MSTLPGLASKGEKGKQKFQSLDINRLYSVSRGENLEKQQQKNTLTYKHGMQSLGKVPNARRAPANLPSLKSEHSGNDASVPLVPPGGPGWGKQESTTPTTAATSTPASGVPAQSTAPNAAAVGATPSANGAVQSTPSPSQQQPLSAHQAAIALPVTTTIVPANAKTATPAAGAATSGDKSWSAIMTGADHPLHHPPLYHSPQFQQEFPSLSVGDGGSGTVGGGSGTVVGGPNHLAQGRGGAGGGQNGGSDGTYAPGLSLRPQTEGSWIQGGSRTLAGEGHPRNGSGQLVVQQQLQGQAGLGPQQQQQQQQQAVPPQFRSVMPTFMYKGNFTTGGNGTPNQGIPTMNGRGRQQDANRQPPARLLDAEDLMPRPIIKEEELSRMDEIDKDLGWTCHDDIDYNQKLAFSDDELDRPTTTRKENKSIKEHNQTQHQQQPPQPTQQQMQNDKRNEINNETSMRSWNNTSPLARQRSSEEELWKQRRNHHKDLELTVQRAKQRKEEEEKRFNEATKQGAAKKLMELEEKLSKRNRDQEDGVGTINQSAVPPKPIVPADIPLPDFQKDKEKERTPTDEEKGGNRNEGGNAFRQLTQIEGKNFARNKGSSAKGGERERERDQNGPGYNRRFLTNVPPRFQKQRNQAAAAAVQSPQSSQQFDGRWSQPKRIDSSPDRDFDERDYRNRSQTVSDKVHDDDYDYGRRNRGDDKWEKDKKNEHGTSVDMGDWYGDQRREKPLPPSSATTTVIQQQQHERPQRPDSRDSRASRDSRHSRDSARESEPREYIGSWAESVLEPAYEEKRRDYPSRDDRRQVPGPITKERIQADDLQSEKRNLTQLKRGQIPDKKSMNDDDSGKKKGENETMSASKAWADAVSSHAADGDGSKFIDDVEKPAKTTENILNESSKVDVEVKRNESETRERDDKRANLRNRPYSQGKGWGGGNEYHRSGGGGWPKRPQSGRHRGQRPLSLAGDSRVTDSEASNDENEHGGKDGLTKNSPKTTRKSEKDERNRETKNDKGKDMTKRDNFGSRSGESSRRGGGGGSSNFRSSRGGLSKRIDGYGPPSSKSPFSHHDDGKKISTTSVINEETTHDGGSNINDDKLKQNQQALSAGIIGSARKDANQAANERKQNEDKNKTKKSEHRRGKSRSKRDEDGGGISDNSDDTMRKKTLGAGKSMGPIGAKSSGAPPLRRNAPPRLSGDKRTYSRDPNAISRQNSSGMLRSKKNDKTDESSTLCAAIADGALKSKDENELQQQIEEGDDKLSLHGDSDGFQEVKSKKTGKERVKIGDEKMGLSKEVPKNDRKPKGNNMPLTNQQSVSNIPPLMGTPVQPPAILPIPPSNKNQFERSRQTTLAPRFAKQRLQKVQMAQQQQQQPKGFCDVTDMNKLNQSMNVYSIKDGTAGGGAGGAPGSVTPIVNAWDKSLGAQLRTIDNEAVLGAATDVCKGLEHVTSQNNSPGTDKNVLKGSQLQDKAILDGTTPPVNTIIFENTNFKSAPGARSAQRSASANVGPDGKSRMKLDDTNPIENPVVAGFNKPIADLLASKANDKTDTTIQLPLSFKEDNADIKLDFFESELSHLTDDKSTSKSLCMPRSIHAMTSANSTISTADALNFKIQSVKKMWETPSDHAVVGQDDTSTFSSSFVGDPNALDPNAFVKAPNDTPDHDDHHEGYSPSPNQVAANSTTNVCKVKPTQQVSGGGTGGGGGGGTGATGAGQPVLAAVTGGHQQQQQHSTLVGPTSLMGNPLSPPPLPTVIGTGVNLGQPPQQFTANQHLNYQTGLGGSSQYGISAIPSPPTVMYNNTQTAAGLYGPFQIDQSGVLGGQGRSQYSQYPNHYGLNQTGSSPYSTQSVYLPTAQPHHPPPPPTAQAPPDLYQSMSNYRLSATAPFGQNQQLNNPTTVLISSTSNSLMSASVKPSNQQIGAIGTKASGVGQAYQQQSQQGQQLYMAYEPALQANFLSNASVMQRPPTGPVQNNVVAALQPSSSYYSGSAGGQTGYFQQPGNSTLQSAQLAQPQTGYGLQGNIFGNQSHTNAGLQSFNSHFLSAPLQIAAALNAQQFRSGLPTQYVKNVSNQQLGDQSGRSQQLKSPASQEVFSSVFNSGSQISSPKLRQNCKQPPPQPSPTAQHKYNLYQSVGNQQSGNRYPTPIQRPANFQQNLSSVQQNNVANGQKHRPNTTNSKTPSRQYYTAQSNALANQSDKGDDTKLNDTLVGPSNNNPTPTSGNTNGKSSVVVGANATPVVVTASEIITKEGIALDDATTALKD